MGTSGVVFDFYGTLVEEHPDDRGRDEELLARRGYAFTGDLRRSWIDPFTTLDHRLDSADEAVYLERRRHRWREALAAAGVASADLDDLVAAAEHRCRSRRFVAFSDVRTVLTDLRGLGLRTAICSNWWWDLDEAVAGCGLADLVDVVVTSAQAGLRKPHPGLFDLVATRLGARAEELLFVGDTWSADVTGARVAGMRAVHLVRDPAAAPGAGDYPPGVIRVASLGELTALLAAP